MERATHRLSTSGASDHQRRRLGTLRTKAALGATRSDSAAVHPEVRCFSSNVGVDIVQMRPRLVPQPYFGVASVIGKRREMEDAVKVVLGLTTILTGEASSGLKYDFFAVYDGHGGALVANKCKERMHIIMAEEVARRWRRPESSEFVCWEDTMVESFRRLDAEMVTKRESVVSDGVKPGLIESVGSTALVAVVGDKKIVVANCGDSRAVLSRGGRAVALSCDHKPNRPDEMQRIEQAGGKVIEWDGYRVWGILATSRSIGDYYLKPSITCDPEVTVLERLYEDEFLILASDGLWDVVSNEMACQIVRNFLLSRITPVFSVTDPLLADAATLLTNIAISRGSKDNISVIVVQLNIQITRRRAVQQAVLAP